MEGVDYIITSTGNLHLVRMLDGSIWGWESTGYLHIWSIVTTPAKVAYDFTELTTNMGSTLAICNNNYLWMWGADYSVKFTGRFYPSRIVHQPEIIMSLNQQ